MKVERAIEVITNAVQTEKMTATQDEALAVIQKAMKKQIPAKMKSFRDICVCGYSVFPHMNFCSRCGQALDWSD